jgi:type I restriction enzyme S subunit
LHKLADFSNIIKSLKPKEMTTNKRLGDYIQEIDVRNRDLSITTLLGVSVNKEFIPSIANTIGTDMSTYKIVHKGQFAYGPVTSRNGDKVSIALHTKEEAAIISQAYTVFEIKDTNKLLPEYLMMWFKRSEFDRYARYMSKGSAHEFFEYGDMEEVAIPIPDIKIQESIANIYSVYMMRKCLNEQLKAQIKDICPILIRGSLEEGK